MGWDWGCGCDEFKDILGSKGLSLESVEIRKGARIRIRRVVLDALMRLRLSSA